MEQHRLKFALFGNIYQTKKSASIQKVLACLSEHDAEIYVDKEYYDFLTLDQRIGVEANGIFEGNDFQADFVISMGGDGTFLKAASRVREKMIPILGVNMGRLGFLADVSPSEIEQCVKALYADDFAIENRALIKVETDGEPLEGYPCALNDVAILKRDTASMISVRANINGEYLTTYQADGLIVATPTGSTAYSLSNGGPIVAPQSGIICLTPVAPHSLNVRPIVIPDTAEITLSVESRSHNFLVAIDGRSEKCLEGTTLTIRRAAHNIKIMRLFGRNYYSTLREKMMWGKDNRN